MQSCLLPTLLLVVCQCDPIYAAFVKPPVQNVSAMCFEAQADFSNYCTTQLNGVTDGGRCYFYADISKGWADSWAICQAYGATMVQIHTGSEHSLLTQYGRANFGDAQQSLLPIRDTQTGYNPCALLPTTTWFSDASTPLTSLPLQKGYLYRYHNCDRTDTQTEPPGRCVIFFQYWSGPFMMSIGDWYCESPATYNVLCEFSNYAQNYSTSVGTCLGEEPMATSSGQDPDECATQCSERQWCRSFNFIEGSNQCELFTWSIADSNVTKVNAQCQHFNYIE